MSTGAAPQRGLRSSRLIFGWTTRWCFRRGNLDAYTGQVGTYSVVINTGAVPTTITGRNGAAVQAGYGHPRWEQRTAQDTVSRLALSGEVTGLVVEQLAFPWPLKVMAMTALVRLWPNYTAGSSVSPAAHALTLGQGTTGGGRLTLRRNGTSWSAVRERQGVSIESSFVEPGGTPYPIDLLISLTSGGALTLSGRSSAGTVTVGNTATNAVMTTVTDIWTDSSLTFNGTTGLVLPGGKWWYELVRIARGTKTYAQMDELS